MQQDFVFQAFNGCLTMAAWMVWRFTCQKVSTFGILAPELAKPQLRARHYYATTKTMTSFKTKRPAA